MSVSGSTPEVYVLDPQVQALALALLVLGIDADYHDATLALDNLALLTNGFYGRFDLHDAEPPLIIQDAPYLERQVMRALVRS